MPHSKLLALWLSLAIWGLFSPCQAAGQRVLHLSPRDSVFILSFGPATTTGGDIVLVQYNPLSSFRDTSTLQRKASELWRALRRQIDTVGLPLVVLRATDRTTLTAFESSVLDIVVERRSDGKWYARGDSVSFEPR
jgi:hypothetical protein